jgi:hypothetical protein
MKKSLFIGITLALALANCKPDFLDRKPLNQIAVSNFYTTETDAFEAIMAAYSGIQSSPKFYGENWYYVLESASDDVTNKLDNEPLDNFNWTPIQGAAGMSRFADLYLMGYEGVYRSNLVLDKVPAIKMDAAKKKVILAEARFLRGLYYWHLIQLFGDAAIYNHVYTLDSIYIVPRSPREDVYKFIEADFKAAIVDLPEIWDASNTGRATKFAAKAFLGKTYLYWACYNKTGNSDALFDNSIVELSEVINSNRFKLLDTFDEVFSPDNENNAESIFEIQYAVRIGGLGWIDDIGIGGEGTKRDLILGIQNQANENGYGELIATQNFRNSFEVGDPRTTQTLYFPWDSSLTGYQTGSNDKYPGVLVYKPSFGTTVKATGNLLGEYYHIKKAVNGYGGAGGIINSGNNWRMMRYSDVLLMCAEAINERQGATDVAVGYLNMVRKRAKDMSKKRASGAQYGEKYEPRLKPDPYDTLSATYINTSTTLPKGYLNPFPYVALNRADQDYFTGNELIDFTTGDMQANLRYAIVLERRYELAFEYHRFLDNKRWEAYMPDHPGAATKVLLAAGVLSYRKRVHQLCPIPQYQIDLMKGRLLQNPGY